jgi:hypothetical protein
MRTQHTRWIWLLLAGVLLLGAWGCDDTAQTGPDTTPSTKTDPYLNDHWSKVKTTQQQQGKVLRVDGRQSRRLSVTHLEKIVKQLFPGLDWRDRTSGGNEMFKRLATTLGKPDYVFVTEGHRIPTALFMKYMDDMAGHLCTKAVTRDLKTQDASKRVLVRYEDVDKNLRYLRLKFHTIYVPDNSTKGIAQLRNLYDKALAKTKKTGDAWNAVCVAVVTAPEFFIY